MFIDHRVHLYHHNVLRRWPVEDKSVHVIFTSPPYWRQRDYGVEGQLGLEPRHDCLGWAEGAAAPVEGCCYICNSRIWASRARRTLRDDGTLIIVVNDTYGKGNGRLAGKTHPSAPRNKDKAGIPFRLALALQADGWYWHSEIPWHKSNGLPNKQAHRVHQSHETILVFSKSPDPHWDVYETLVKDRDNFAVDGRFAITDPEREGDDSYLRTADFLYESVRQEYLYHIAAAQDIVEAMDKGTGRKHVLPGLDGILSANGGNSSGNYAGFNSFLVETLLKCAAPRKVCVVCDAPLVRLVEKVTDGYADRQVRSKYTIATTGEIGDPGQSGLSVAKRWVTVGWQKSCDCLAGNGRATVLDPFVGGGSTMRAALALGHYFIGLDVSGAAIEECRTYVEPNRKETAVEDFGPLFNLQGE